MCRWATWPVARRSASAADDVLRDAPETFSLAGFSLGAVVALEIMRRAPERVERLALLSANAGGSTPEHFAAWDGLGGADSGPVILTAGTLHPRRLGI